MFGREKNSQKWYMNRSPGERAGGGGFNTFVWRSIKKIFLSLLLLAMLGWSAFAANIDDAIAGKVTWTGALMNSFVAALNNGYTEFIPRMIAIAQHLAAQEPAQAFLLNALPNIVVFLFTFLWVSFVADILDQRKYEAFSFSFITILTLLVVAVLSISGFGYVSVMSLMNGG